MGIKMSKGPCSIFDKHFGKAQEWSYHGEANAAQDNKNGNRYIDDRVVHEHLQAVTPKGKTGVTKRTHGMKDAQIEGLYQVVAC